MVDVDDREVRLRILLRDLRDRGRLVEADGDDEVRALPRGLREVRDVGLRRRGLVDDAVDPELLLRPLQALIGELVEAVVVELVDVRDQDDECLRARAARRRSRGRSLP